MCKMSNLYLLSISISRYGVSHEYFDPFNGEYVEIRGMSYYLLAMKNNKNIDNTGAVKEM